MTARAVNASTLFVCLIAAALLTGGCGEESASTGDAKGVSSEDPGPVHVHGLGVTPRDRALFIATHTGLFRLAATERKAKRVASRYQDTMAFTVVGPDRFLGSGHPDAREGLPPFLGLIESRDAGQSWKPISLLGKADFHLLERAGSEALYGFGSDWETREERLLLSRDGGRRWDRLKAPDSLVGLAAAPDEPRRILAAGQRALWRSDDGGARWTRLGAHSGLLDWPRPNVVFRVDAAGRVHRSGDQGRRWQAVARSEGNRARSWPRLRTSCSWPSTTARSSSPRTEGRRGPSARRPDRVGIALERLPTPSGGRTSEPLPLTHAAPAPLRAAQRSSPTQDRGRRAGLPAVRSAAADISGAPCVSV